MSLQSIMDNVALVVGGTAPNLTTNPGWYSGEQAGDTTGVQSTPTFKGCYSQAPEVITASLPCGLVIPGPFTATLIAQGEEPNEDLLDLYVFLAKTDTRRQMPNLTQFRDLVPAVFRSHMQLNTQVNLDAFVISGVPGHYEWGGTTFLGWKFVVRVRRMIQPTYTA